MKNVQGIINLWACDSLCPLQFIEESPMLLSNSKFFPLIEVLYEHGCNYFNLPGCVSIHLNDI